MSKQTETEDRRPGLMESFFRRTPQPVQPQPVATPTRHGRKSRREPDPTPAEVEAMRRRAQEWQESYDRQQARGRGRGHVYCAPSGTCTPTRFHVTGHPDDEAGHAQYRPSLLQRIFGRRDNGIGPG